MVFIATTNLVKSISVRRINDKRKKSTHVGVASLIEENVKMPKTAEEYKKQYAPANQH